ncbi:MAG: GMP synthase (glutamine-hydrolyzing), partial [archaeon]|nr:GMP synthase (glutamine-hydrolyzing) [archaeon]
MDLVILDFGGQYVFNIRRCFLEFGVDAEIMPLNTSADVIRNLNVKGIVLSGGPYSVYDEGAP